MRPRARTEYQADPVRYCHEVLGHFPWSEPRDIHQAIIEERNVAIRGGKGWGKTRTLSEAVCHEVECFPDTVLISTATTWVQVAEQLWREVHSAVHGARKKLPGRLLDTKWELDDRWFALGISTKKPESLAGFHASMRIAKKYAGDPEGWSRLTDEEFFGAVLEEIEALGDAPRVVVLVDEASGIDDRLWPALDGLLTNPGSKMIIAGNPTRLQGRHFKVFHPEGEDPTDTPERKRGWRLFTVDARRAPRAIVSQESLDAYAKQCGPEPEKNPIYQCDVMGIHPTSTEFSVYPLALLHAAALAQPKTGGLWMGIDVARHGPDRNVAVLVDNGRVVGIKIWGRFEGQTPDFPRSALVIKKLIEAWEVPGDHVNLLATGIGWGLYDLVKDVGVNAVDEGAGVEGDWADVFGRGPRLANRKQELAWITQRCLQEGLLCIPNSSRYAPIWNDLVNIERKRPLTGSEEWAIEPTDVYYSRVGRSPDAAAALFAAQSRSTTLRVHLAIAGGPN